MKAIVFLVASACLINGLAAYSISFPSEDETLNFEESEKSVEIDDHLDIFFPDKHATENMIVPFPTDDPEEPSTRPRPSTTTTTGRPRPTWRPTTSTPRPTTTTERPRPTTTTRRPRPTWRPTTPTPRPTTTTGRPRPTTTTRRPRPTWRPTTPTPRPTTTTGRPRPTWRPTTSRPTTSRPGRRNPQIYNNSVRSLGPFAGRLTNVVLNKQGAQKTVQENDIVYNLNSFLKRMHNYEEETEN